MEKPIDVTLVLAVLAVLCFIAAALILYYSYSHHASSSHQAATTAHALSQVQS
jgi:hypothetical protein